MMRAAVLHLNTTTAGIIIKRCDSLILIRKSWTHHLGLRLSCRAVVLCSALALLQRRGDYC